MAEPGYRPTRRMPRTGASADVQGARRIELCGSAPCPGRWGERWLRAAATQASTSFSLRCSLITEPAACAPGAGPWLANGSNDSGHRTRPDREVPPPFMPALRRTKPGIKHLERWKIRSNTCCKGNHPDPGGIGDRAMTFSTALRAFMRRRTPTCCWWARPRW